MKGVGRRVERVNEEWAVEMRKKVYMRVREKMIRRGSLDVRVSREKGRGRQRS